MTPTYNYLGLRSNNRQILVQVFTDPETGSILYAEIRTRRSRWGRWEPPTELERLEP